CGGIENARVLLDSPNDAGTVLGNGHDLVGRFFACHGRLRTGILLTDRSELFQTVYNSHTGRDGTRCQIGLALGAGTQRTARVLNASAVLEYRGRADSGVTAGREIWLGLQEGHWVDHLGEKVCRVVTDFDEVVATVGRRQVDGLPTI